MQSSQKRPVVIISCPVFKSLIEERLSKNRSVRVIFLDYGLHQVPKYLNETLQNEIDQIEEPSNIILGYGLCGNGLNGIRSGIHTLIAARADDCITILLGSYDEYRRIFDNNPGTYFLTKGWLESGNDPLREYQVLLEKYDEPTAQWIIDQQYKHYKKLVLVAHSQEDLDKYRPRALEVANFCKRWSFTYEEILGSDRYINNLLKAIEVVPKPDEDFIVVPPGGQIKQNEYFRQR